MRWSISGRSLTDYTAARDQRCRPTADYERYGISALEFLSIECRNLFYV